MKDKPTITIAIPAYNEEANIGYLLDDLNKQKTDDFILEKIIINSDGSTDKTNEIVKQKRKDNEKIILKENKENRDAPYRQNEMFRMVKSNIIVLINADIKIEDPEFLEKIIQPLINKEADLTSCPILETEPVTTIEKAIHMSMKIKNKIFEKFNNGNNVYTCHGPARSFSKRLYQNLEFIDGPGEDAYSYLYCIKNGFKYKFVKNTYVKYRLSDNFLDYRKQSLRFIESKKLMEKEFGKEFVQKQYKIPIIPAIKVIVTTAAKNPFLSILYIAIFGMSSLGYRFTEVPQGKDLSQSSRLPRKINEEKDL